MSGITPTVHGRPPDGEETRRYWNERHAGAIFNDEPAEWLREQRRLLEAQRPGRALDIACCGGRNAVLVVDLAADPIVPNPPYRVVIDFFYLERSLFDAVANALAPGGLLLFETFVGERPCESSLGPRFSLDRGELRDAFAALEILHYDEVLIGDEQSGRRTIARLAARR